MATVSQRRVHAKVKVMIGGTGTADSGHAALEAAAIPEIPVLHFLTDDSTGVTALNVFITSRQSGTRRNTKVAITHNASPTIANS